jgi:hypothetical protein
MISDDVDAYRNSKTHRYGFVENIELSRHVRGNQADDYLVKVILRVADSDDRIRMEFRGAREIQFGRLEGLVASMISIIDVSDRQLEGLRYRVTDQEHGVISLYCASFSAEV